MKTLELKIHPPIVLLVCLGLVYGSSHYLPLLAIPQILSNLYPVVAVLGVMVPIAGLWEFMKAKTTINPTQPEKSSTLVKNGIYAFTRNPMYLGMQFIIIAAVLKWANYLGFIALPCFVFYITQFQIKPEERIIEGIFAEEYKEYKTKVRRWL